MVLGILIIKWNDHNIIQQLHHQTNFRNKIVVKVLVEHILFCQYSKIIGEWNLGAGEDGGLLKFSDWVVVDLIHSNA